MYLPLSLISRQHYNGYNRCGYYNNCHSNWYRWGRWVLAGILILVGISVLFFILCCASRRRRRSRRNQITSTPMVSQPPTGSYANGGYYNQNYNPPPRPAQPTYSNEYGYRQQAGVTQPGQTYQPYK